MRIIFWAGDSTNTTNKAHKYPQTGIAQAFDRYTAQDVVIYNHSINGRSTKSFMDQGRLATIYNEIDVDNFLFIQFGHNDEKDTDPLRYTNPSGDFIDNLGKFVNVARNRGAHPLLITPVERRLFNADGRTLKAPSAHEPYVDGYKEASRRFDVPLVDLWSASRKLLESTGDEASVKYFMHLKPNEALWCPDGQEDDTHLKYEGAMVFGRLLASELCKLDKKYATLIDKSVLDTLTEQEQAALSNTGYIAAPDRDLTDEKNMGL